MDPEHAHAGEEFGGLEKQIKASGMPKAIKEKALLELDKLKLMPMTSAEATVVRGYLEWLLKMPWKQSSRVNHDLNKAQACLEADHYGLDKVKERILEYLAVATAG